MSLYKAGDSLAEVPRDGRDRVPSSVLLACQGGHYREVECFALSFIPRPLEAAAKRFVLVLRGSLI